MNPPWNQAWTVLEARCAAVGEQLVRDGLSVSWTLGHSENDSFPFRAWAAFSADPANDDVVVSIDFRWTEEAVLYTADVARDDGEILAEGPTGTVLRGADGTVGLAELRTAIQEIANFVDGVAPQLEEALRLLR